MAECFEGRQLPPLLIMQHASNFWLCAKAGEVEVAGSVFVCTSSARWERAGGGDVGWVHVETSSGGSAC